MNDSSSLYFQGSLEKFATPPQNWQWGSFSRDGRNLRYGYVLPETPPKAIVIGLQGLSEFCEKYFETAQDMLDRGCGFFMMDWVCQGKSSRLLKNPHKRHSTGFDDDLADLHEFITHHVMPARDKQASNAPLIFLGHSMGGHLGLRYLYSHPAIIERAAFSAPMIGIHAVSWMQIWLQKGLSALLNTAFGTAYVWGGQGWDAALRDNVATNTFSDDPVRRKIHNAWSLEDPALQIGNVTFGWIYHALRSCHALQAELPEIKTPCVLATAEKDVIVDNKAIKRAAETLPSAALLEIPDAKHEILVETDIARQLFLTAFDQLIQG